MRKAQNRNGIASPALKKISSRIPWRTVSLTAAVTRMVARTGILQPVQAAEKESPTRKEPRSPAGLTLRVGCLWGKRYKKPGFRIRRRPKKMMTAPPIFWIDFRCCPKKFPAIVALAPRRINRIKNPARKEPAFKNTVTLFLPLMSGIEIPLK